MVNSVIVPVLGVLIAMMVCIIVYKNDSRGSNG